MVKITLELPGVSKVDLYRLEDKLDDLFHKKYRLEVGWGGNSPESYLHLAYKNHWYSLATSVEIDASGTIEDGPYKVELKINLPEKTYSKIEDILIAVPEVNRALRSTKEWLAHKS